MNNIQNIIGKKIVALKGVKVNRKNSSIPVQYIMLDDGESYLELEEQDYYTYHDCSSFARTIYFYNDQRMWGLIMSGAPDKKGDKFYLDATEKLNMIGL